MLAFFGLLRAIPQLEARADRRALLVAATGANPGEHGESFERLYNTLTEQAGEEVQDRGAGAQLIRPGVTPGALAVEPGTLSKEHAEQMARADDIRRQWLARLGRPAD